MTWPQVVHASLGYILAVVAIFAVAWIVRGWGDE